MTNSHPYKSKPNSAFWSRSIASVPISNVDPVIKAKYRIEQTDKIATIGSCFAQHISRYLSSHGFNYLITETAHPVVQHLTQGFNYGTYTARYGNVYTAAQLKQLLWRAYGEFKPVEDIWRQNDGQIIDPFRPEIQAGGFSSEAELLRDRNQHFAAIRQMIETMDVLVLTLGLTEAWMSKKDKAVFPICPGVIAGEFDETAHEFKNFSYEEVVEDLEISIEFIRKINRNVKFLVTVSPVPLKATAEDRSVLVSTVYSKSVLRIAAEKISRNDNVAYFPSFEIITGSFNRGAYFFGRSQICHCRGCRTCDETFCLALYERR